MKTKILLLFPSSPDSYGVNESTHQPPLGMAYLAALLEKKGFSCGILDANFLRLSVSQTVDAVRESGAGIIGLSLYAFNFAVGLEIARAIKETMAGTIVIAGGAHPSAIAKETLEKGPFLDAVISGEGEMTLLEIMGALAAGGDPFKGVDGVIYRSQGSVIENAARGRIADLDSLPFPAFHMYPALGRYKRRVIASPAVPILTSRGCPYECVFCSKCVFGRQVYYRSSGNVIAEIDYLVERFGAKQLDIVDDNFITDKRRAVVILERLAAKPRKLAVNLQSGVSATLIDKEMLRLMKAAGVYRIAFGVESGNESVLESIKKRQKLDDVAEAVRLAKDAGIRADAFFMVGLPGESEETMRDTIDFAKKLDPHTANFHMAVPFPGTELYSIVKTRGKFLKTTDDGITSGYNYPEAFYELDGLKKESVERYYKKAYREFYFRPRKIIRTMLDVRSFEEFLWLCNTAMLVVASFFKKRDARQ